MTFTIKVPFDISEKGQGPHLKAAALEHGAANCPEALKLKADVERTGRLG